MRVSGYSIGLGTSIDIPVFGSSVDSVEEQASQDTYVDLPFYSGSGSPGIKLTTGGQPLPPASVVTVATAQTNWGMMALLGAGAFLFVAALKR